MSAKFRLIAPLMGATALVAWTIALGQALPRLMAGPLCSSRQDAWSLAGHCPACFFAAALTIAFAASMVLAQNEAASPQAIRNAFGLSPWARPKAR